jgi:VanZ family protein
VSDRLGRLARLAPPFAWMGVIAVFSSHLFGADETGSWLLPLLGRLLPSASAGLLHALHATLRKIGHVVEYGVLAALWLRALDPAQRAAAAAVGLSALYAAFDEVHQSVVPNRTASLLDVLLDTAGALLAVALVRGRGPVAVAGVRLVRWAAAAVAAGSALAAVVDWSLGLPAWDVLAAAGLALGAVLLLRRLEGRWG